MDLGGLEPWNQISLLLAFPMKFWRFCTSSSPIHHSYTTLTHPPPCPFCFAIDSNVGFWKTSTSLQSFLAHQKQINFYSDPRRLSPNSLHPPHPALRNAIYLLGCFFLGESSPYASLAEVFLRYALDGLLHALGTPPSPVSDSRRSSQSDLLISLDGRDHEREGKTDSKESPAQVDLIQASCLVGQYFYFRGNKVQGYRHCFAAARMATTLGMHQLPNPQPSSQHLGHHSAHPSIATPHSNSGFARHAYDVCDAPDDRENKIAVFWQVFTVDRLWSAGMGLVSALPDENGRKKMVTTVLPTMDGRPLVCLSAMIVFILKLTSCSVRSYPSLCSCIIPRLDDGGCSIIIDTLSSGAQGHGSGCL